MEISNPLETSSSNLSQYSQINNDFLEDYKQDFQIIKEIENCFYYKIYKAKNIKEGRNCCLKVIDKQILKQEDYDYYIEQINREKEITQLCKSDYIIDIYQKLETQNKIIFEMEYWEMNFYEYIKKKRPLVDNLIFFKRVILDITEALKILNKYEVIHRDIKTRNIFLIKDNIKLGGFGSLIFLKDNNSEPVGSFFYSAPEIIKSLEYDEKCDLWSLGITLYEILFGYLPYGKVVTPNLIKKSIIYADNFIYGKTNIKEINILFEKLLTINRKNRISYKDYFDYINKKIKVIDVFNSYKNSEETEEDNFSSRACSINFSKIRYSLILMDEIKEEKNIYSSKNNVMSKIINIVEDGNLIDIMNFPNGSIDSKQIKKYNNILYYDENINYINSINNDSNFFEKNTPGAFIL